MKTLPALVLSCLVLPACTKANPVAIKAEVDKMIVELAAVEAALPAESKESPCALDKFKPYREDQLKFRTIYAIDEEQLKLLTKAKPGAPPPASSPWAFTSSHMFPTLTELLSSTPSNDGWETLGEHAKSYTESEAYVAVLRTVARAMPGTATDGAFKRGWYEGWVVIFDRAGRKPLCQSRFTASNSASVKTPAIGIGFAKLAINEQKAINKDFRVQVKAQATAVTRKMTNGQTGLAFADEGIDD